MKMKSIIKDFFRGVCSAVCAYSRILLFIFCSLLKKDNSKI